MRILPLVVIALVAAALTGCALESAGAPEPTATPTATLSPSTPHPPINTPPASPPPREDSFRSSSPSPSPTHSPSAQLSKEPRDFGPRSLTTPGAEPTPLLEERTTEALTQQVSPRVKPGIEALVKDQPHLVEGERIGLITNQTGIGPDGRGNVEWLSSIPGARVVALFAGEHGILGTEEAGKRLPGGVDPDTGIRVYSLYGEKYNGQKCQGVEIVFTDRRAYQAVLTTLSVLDAYGRSASRPISGGSAIAGLRSGRSVAQLVQSHQAAIKDFLTLRQKYLPY